MNLEHIAETPDSSNTDYEQKRRALMLRTGMLSDWNVTTPVGTFALHSATRCQYLWNLVAAGHTSAERELRLDPPVALETDGAWQRADFDRLWWHMYATEAQWSRDWQEARAHLDSANDGATLADVQAWLRLHRLADFVQYEALVVQIEQFLLGPVLNSWAFRALVHAHDPSEFLLPRMQAVFDACEASSDARARIARGILHWILAIGAGLHSNSDQLLADWRVALAALPLCERDQERSAITALLMKDDTTVHVTCNNCFKRRRPRAARECGRGDEVSNDVQERACLRDAEWLVFQATRTPTIDLLVHVRDDAIFPVPPLVDYVHADLHAQTHVVARGACASERDSNTVVSVFVLPPAKSAPIGDLVLMPGLRGRCAQCGVCTEALHVTVLRAYAATQVREVLRCAA
jgi:hypothetical protein